MKNEFSAGSKALKGHMMALFTASVWGVTFISSKVLLRTFSPVEVLFVRFLIGFLVLMIICPRRMPFQGWRGELPFFLCGLSGITCYYFLENMALTYAQASTVSLIICTAPFFTALLAHFFLKEKALTLKFFAGFVLSMIGIVMITLSDGSTLEFGFLGSILAVLAAFTWGIYSICTRRAESFGYNTLQMTQRFFFYGVLCMIPGLPVMSFHPELAELVQPVNLLNFLFLGIVACAGCFVTWNYALKTLGTVKTTMYVYLSPVITVLASIPILGEKLTVLSIAGIILTMAGVILSER